MPDPGPRCPTLLLGTANTGFCPGCPDAGTGSGAGLPAGWVSGLGREAQPWEPCEHPGPFARPSGTVKLISSFAAEAGSSSALAAFQARYSQHPFPATVAMLRLTLTSPHPPFFFPLFFNK